MPERTATIRTIVLLAATASLVLTAGCYTRVVGVKNAPNYTGEVYEPNVEEGNENLFKTKTRTYKGTSFVD
ncbi:MAG: hypothetical protein GWP75_03830 [Planctomycetia bacterium]|jgi:hypothetical protein|nr:hypothetical protein [Planctomycetia bacterium]